MRGKAAQGEPGEGEENVLRMEIKRITLQLSFFAQDTTMGSTREARRAGAQQAISAMTAEQRGDGSEGDGIGRGDTGEQIFHGARRDHAATSPMASPMPVRASPRPTIIANHACGARAEGHAESDFAAALRHRVGEHAIQSDGREDSASAANGEQSHLLLAVGDVEVDDFVHRAELGDGLVGIDGGDDAADGGRERGRLGVRFE